jgi:hypothetical protein
MALDTDDHATEIRADFLLDQATREARLWDRARGRVGRLTFEDLSYLLAIAGLAAMFLWRSGVESVPPPVLLLIGGLGAAGSWRAFRLSRRLDAIVRLLEKHQRQV